MQAVFLLAFLVDGFSPVLDLPITELLFQAKVYGYHTDDLVAVTAHGSRAGKTLCQIKNDITVSKRNRVFQEVVTAAWNDLNSSHFNAETDRIVLITNTMAKSSMNALRKIYEQANSTSNAEDFFQRINQSNFTDEGTNNKFGVLRYCLDLAKGGELMKSEVHAFCKVFLPIIFDGNYAGSIHETLCKSLIRCKSNEDPRKVWNVLTEYAGKYNQRAARINKNTVDLELKELFGYKLLDRDLDSFLPSEKWAQLVLIGAWNENCESDKTAIEEIICASYSEVLGFAREQLNAGSQYLSLINGIWRVTLRKELFPRVKDYFYDNIIKNAFQVASKLVGEISKRFTDEDSCGIIEPEGGWFSNSQVFRKSLCEGLCLMANGIPPKYASKKAIETEEFFLVHSLFGQRSWKTFAGLGDLLSLIAELSPKTYLQELEAFSVEQVQELKNLFPTGNHRALLDTNYMTHILWSLETLAWIPDYFGACVRCLGMIEQAGYEKTNYANTPINSIITIMNAFRPQTFASVEKKKHAILALQKDSPELCWTVLQALLPESSYVMTDTQKPKYISFSSFERIVPQEETTEMLQYYIDSALQLSIGSAERLAELSTHTGYMSDSMISDYLNQIITDAMDWSDEMKYPVWDRLCELRVRVILDNDHEKPDTELFLLLEQAIGATTPKEKWYLYLHLYTRNLDEYCLDDMPQKWELRDKDREKAVRDLYDSYGIESILSFGTHVNDLYDVGRKLGGILNNAQIIDVLDRYSKDTESVFYAAVLDAYISANGIDSLSMMDLGKYNASFRVKVLFAAPLSPDTFTVIEKYLPDKIMYWKNVPVTWFSPTWSQQTLEYVIHELKEAGRFDVIIHSLGYFVEKYDLPDKMLETVLLGAVSAQLLNQIKPYDACCIIQKLQNSDSPDIDVLAEIEYAYLPFLEEPYPARPKALYFKLSNDENYFCKLMELVYKPRHEEHRTRNLSEGVLQRLFLLIHHYCVVPGVDWNGDFNAEKFHEWMTRVLTWAEQTDRMEVTQHTIGNGLSFAKFEDGLPNDTIMTELNKPHHKEMRLGYQLGIQNQRGVHVLDPEGKQEYALAEKFHNYANTAEKRGYSRFSETLEAIAESYQHEAERNKHQAEMYFESEG